MSTEPLNDDEFDADMAKLRTLEERIFTEADAEQLRAIAEKLNAAP